MRRANYLLLSMGSAALICAGAAVAGPPSGFTFNDWTVSNGDIALKATTCPTGYTCGSPILGKGFLQRQLKENASGIIYFQTIVTNQDATFDAGTATTRPFSDENFVRTGVTGISSRQSIQDTTIDPITSVATDFATSLVLDTGWASTLAGKEAQMEITQSLTQATTGFTNDFILQQEGSGDTVLGRWMSIDQGVDLTPESTTTTDLQEFVLVQVKGNKQTTTRDAASTANDPVDLLPTGATSSDGAAPSNDLSWTAGQEIKVVWIGQDMASAGQKYGFQAYTNVADANRTISYFEIGGGTGPFEAPGTPAPYAWLTDPFGTKPTF
ncbi:MAG TPA: hypothetical protein ENJ19_10285 [Gammaproteobacteria bacterium]|nr:hypothetical protein [Gammaproteobacteria bacterium]